MVKGGGNVHLGYSALTKGRPKIMHTLFRAVASLFSTSYARPVCYRTHNNAYLLIRGHRPTPPSPPPRRYRRIRTPAKCQHPKCAQGTKHSKNNHTFTATAAAAVQHRHPQPTRYCLDRLNN